MTEKRTEMAREAERGLTSRRSILEPTRMVDRFVDEMDRVFDDVFGRGWLSPRPERSRWRWRTSDGSVARRACSPGSVLRSTPIAGVPPRLGAGFQRSAFSCQLSALSSKLTAVGWRDR